MPKEHSIVTERSHPRKAAPFWSTFAGARSVRWLLGGVIKVQASFSALPSPVLPNLYFIAPGCDFGRRSDIKERENATGLTLAVEESAQA